MIVPTPIRARTIAEARDQLAGPEHLRQGHLRWKRYMGPGWRPTYLPETHDAGTYTGRHRA